MTRRKRKPWLPEQDPRTRGCDERPRPRVGDVRMDGDLFKRLKMVGTWKYGDKSFRWTEWTTLPGSQQ